MRDRHLKFHEGRDNLRLDAAAGYCEAGRAFLDSGCEEVPFGFEGWLGAAYVYSGRPELSIELIRAQLARGRDSHTLGKASLAVILMMAGSDEEAMATTTGLIESAEATHNPLALSFALLAYGITFRDADHVRALNALRRGLVVAQRSGNRYNESHLAAILCRAEAKYGDPLAALDHFTLAIRNYHNSGNTTLMRVPLAGLAAFLDQVGRHEPAATIAGFAVDTAITTAAVPEITTAITHLRDVLGNETYESLALTGEAMTSAEIAGYAFGQINHARAELIVVSD